MPTSCFLLRSQNVELKQPSIKPKGERLAVAENSLCFLLAYLHVDRIADSAAMKIRENRSAVINFAPSWGRPRPQAKLRFVQLCTTDLVSAPNAPECYPIADLQQAFPDLGNPFRHRESWNIVAIALESSDCPQNSIRGEIVVWCGRSMEPQVVPTCLLPQQGTYRPSSATRVSQTARWRAAKRWSADLEFTEAYFV